MDTPMQSPTLKDEPMQIDTRAPAKSVYEVCYSSLETLVSIQEMSALRQTVETLHKIITNIMAQPLE
jgi:hypothetical protein